MRLKEDSYSYKSSGIKRRLFRQSPLEDRGKTIYSKKDTKKWCRGKVGLNHKLTLIEISGFFTIKWKVEKCQNCNKVFHRYVKP